MTELESKMIFVLQVKWYLCLVFVAQKLIKPKLGNIRMEYKKILSTLNPFLRYGVHKICNFELFCWQYCWSDSLKNFDIICALLRFTEFKKSH
ncbi:hypothetical protein O3M35_007064 [Rhynocoris fuscipes]|uniref:Uncharacterized protein n=1 Tax=Rhynocoris fuscipes TaxID=488301 RepID=A0AAW1D8Q0_9HEMI